MGIDMTLQYVIDYRFYARNMWRICNLLMFDVIDNF